jgi:hypothetical protein
MIQRFFIFLTCALLCIQASAQKPHSQLDHFSAGFQLNQYQKDFGLGLQVTSPFIREVLALRLAGNVQWLENIPPGDSLVTWTSYSNFRIGLIGKRYVLYEQISIYGEGGILVILPNSNFSSKETVVGGYGVFGFEFNPVTSFGYFLELGGVGTGATAG